MSSSIYRQHLENYLKGLEITEKRVIDVGGASNPVSKRVKSWDVQVYHVLDNELEKRNITVDFNHDMNVEFKVDIEPYNLVFCLEMMDYIWDPVQATINLRYLCKPGARLIMTFPFIYPNHNPFPYDMLRYTKQGANKLLNNAGFKVKEVHPRRMSNTSHWYNLMVEDGYRYRGAEEAGTLFDAGYIIEAVAI